MIMIVWNSWFKVEELEGDSLLFSNIEKKLLKRSDNEKEERVEIWQKIGASIKSDCLLLDSFFWEFVSLGMISFIR